MVEGREKRDVGGGVEREKQTINLGVEGRWWREEKNETGRVEKEKETINMGVEGRWWKGEKNETWGGGEGKTNN